MHLSRRSLLRAAGATAAVTAVPSLAACSDGGKPGAVPTGAAVPWPAYVPAKVPAPDLPGTPQSQAGYTAYPTSVTSTGQPAPGDGSTVRAWVISYGAPPKPAASNQFWQAVNKALNINLELTIVPNADYPAKVQTLVAGNDLPDLICVFSGYGLPRDTQFLPAQCADLSEHLSGDAVKTYPNLANIPTYAWQGMGRIGGHLYGVPIERSPSPSTLFINDNALTAAGYTGAWSRDQFTTVAKTLSGNRKYALGGSTDTQLLYNFHAASHGAPNTWRLDGGKFVSTFETPEFKAAVGYMRDLWQAGVYHPDSVTISTANIQTQFFAQSVAAIFGNIGSAAPMITGVNGAFDINLAQLYSGAGGTPAAWGGGGLFGYTAMKKAAPDRIRMLLRVLDFLAAPFGTKEYELFHYGVEGVHFTRGSTGAPTPTPLWTGGENAVTLPVKYLCDAPGVLYFPGLPAEKLTKLFEWQRTAVKNVTFDPTRGMKSATQASQGLTIYKLITDGLIGVVTGRTPLSAWDETVKNWKRSGGDTIAGEYAQYAAANN
ncbi:hypothetical protein ACQP1P_16990 [Dactylosporangium sp. CA-052675]|uniref:hypothetical protein n=1 Tax=Dactylosporangium sp. CA-052675 TaxID=3239927 RepID=UPI003D89FEAC